MSSKVCDIQISSFPILILKIQKQRQGTVTAQVCGRQISTLASIFAFAPQLQIVTSNTLCLVGWFCFTEPYFKKLLS